ncbi:hypothetical protein M404DRAFT_999677 [Pisolithus tinctorius Marx 270]|uniref:DUF6534 domain-containing protein n=1 Tax=Pisolithus tinctorius Marx 270 TaxID=870435 RepID=A0A0C3PBY0_PISTI|nr:hypothetical protein M404DRAFT_999677 [Pisolithus tinctorius Marx 270]
MGGLGKTWASSLLHNFDERLALVYFQLLCTDRRLALSETSKGMAANLAQNIQGPFLIGLIINVFLYGVTTTQVHLYFSRHNRDKLWVKSLIVVLYLAETFNSAISTYYIYDVLVIHFGDEAYLLSDNWGQSMIFLTEARLSNTPAQHSYLGAVSGVVQDFFAWRVYMLTKNVFVVAVIVLCSLVNLAGSVAATISMATSPRFSMLPNIEAEVAIWRGAAVLADIIIAASLVWHLKRRKHLYPALTSTINRILRMTVQTGVLTSIVAIIDLVCYMAIVDLSPAFPSHLIFSMALSKIYTNCMISTLNARGGWKYDGPSGDEVSHRRSSHPESVMLQARSTQPEVFVQLETHQMIEMGDKSVP